MRDDRQIEKRDEAGDDEGRKTVKGISNGNNDSCPYIIMLLIGWSVTF